jgi:hypothetical protein
MGLLALPAVGQTTPEEAVQRIVPDLFAGILWVTLSEELSGLTMRIDSTEVGADDTRLSTFHFPWDADYPIAGLLGALHLEAMFGLLVADDHFEFDTTSGLATVSQDWTIVGARVGAGWGFPLAREWWLRPGLTLALAYLENDARYNAAGEIELKPLIDGTLVNWDGWAVSPAVNLVLERARAAGQLDYGFEARYGVAHTRVFQATSSAQEDTDTSRSLAARAELGAPLGQRPDGDLLAAWDVFASGVQLGAIERDALGFERFFELGAGCRRAFRRLPPLRLEIGWIFGADVRGYTVGVSLGR